MRAAAGGGRATQGEAALFRRNWKRAQAAVIVAENYVSTMDGAAGLPSRSKIVLEVRPADDAPFRAEVDLNLLGFNQDLRNLIPPEAGETLEVKYDPRSHKVEVVVDPAHDRRVQDRADEEAYQAALHAPPGTQQPASNQRELDHAREEFASRHASELERMTERAQARIVGIETDGTRGDIEVARVKLRVAPDNGGQPWETQVRLGVTQDGLSRLAPGTTYGAAYDPAQPLRVKLDGW
jgi:hypothetical protein